MIYILIRTISAYVFTDIILGIFTTLAEAEQAKTTYILYRKNNDPWQDQPYRETILEDDVNIMEVLGSFENGQLVFEVSEYFEGFGQDERDLNSIHETLNVAQQHIEMLEAVEHSFPHCALIDYLIIGELHSDLSQDQPSDFINQDRTYLEKFGKRKFAEIIHIAFPQNKEA